MTVGRRNLLPLLVLLAGSHILAACSDTTEPVVQQPLVVTVAVTPKPASLRLGKTVQLSATITELLGRPVNEQVSWSATGAAATVDAAGLVTSRALGSAVITARTSTAADSFRIDVVTPVLQGSPLAVGVTHSCGIADDGKTYCWGHNSYGILGVGTADLAAHPTPETVVTALSFTSISSEGGFTCGLTSDSRAYCWGVDRGGSLGTTSTQSCTGEIGVAACSTVPVPVATTQAFRAVYAMWAHGCALTTGDSRAYCWGPNTRGQLGTGNTTSSSLPLAVNTGLRFNGIVGSNEHTCGLATDSRVYCWGDNSVGQLGLGSVDAIAHTFPTAVNTTLTFRSITAHGQNGGHTCGIGSDGKAYCWGNNEFGQLGTGATANVASPTPVATDLRFELLAAGANWTCGLTAEGKAYCWGGSFEGAISGTTRTCTGPSGTLACATTPVEVPGGITFATLRLGSGNACGVTVDNRAYCWGANDTGKLGNGTTTDSSTPTLVTGGRLFPAS
jgi:alpha-tubulin suppressor-like RCC1 family protein